MPERRGLSGKHKEALRVRPKPLLYRCGHLFKTGHIDLLIENSRHKLRRISDFVEEYSHKLTDSHLCSIFKCNFNARNPEEQTRQEDLYKKCLELLAYRADELTEQGSTEALMLLIEHAPESFSPDQAFRAETVVDAPFILNKLLEYHMATWDSARIDALVGVVLEKADVNRDESRFYAYYYNGSRDGCLATIVRLRGDDISLELIDGMLNLSSSLAVEIYKKCGSRFSPEQMMRFATEHGHAV